MYQYISMNNEYRDYFGLTKGLSGTQLKIIGIIMMVFDHLYYMFHINGIPYWFHWVGRPVAPIFLFICAEGFKHTHSKKNYILRLLVCFELMNVVNEALSVTMPHDSIELLMNIFGSLFFAALYMLFVDILWNGIKNKKIWKVLIAVLFMLLPIVYSLGTLSINLTEETVTNHWLGLFLYKFIPNVMKVEGTFLGPLLGLLFYILRHKQILQIIPIVVFAIVFAIAMDSHWLMIFTIIPVLLYNGSRGMGGKYFFYIFYPAHIYVFYVIAYFIQRK